MIMSEGCNGIFVVTAGKEVFIRVVGRGTFQNSQPLRQHGNEMIQNDFQEFYIDLARCQGMDSTFLGVLAGFGITLRQGGQIGHLHILNADQRNLHSLSTLGLDRLLQVEPAEPGRPQPPETEFRKLPGSDAGAPAKSLEKFTAAKLMLDAHEALCHADERNESKFKDVKDSLRQKISGNGGQPENQNYEPV